jgi:hypothetical protein
MSIKFRVVAVVQLKLYHYPISGQPHSVAFVIPSEVEEWSGSGSRDMDGKAEG